MAKLSKFILFADTLFPIEAELLTSNNKLEDDEKRRILESVLDNTYSNDIKESYDETIDKRKYSYIKTWIVHSLSKIDVDKNLEYLIECDKNILLDNISSSEEKSIIALFQNSDCTHFNFMKIYELARNYRHYLQIRLRYEDYETVATYLEKNRTNYEYSLLINEKIHLVSKDIILNYSEKKVEQVNWFQWLLSVLYDPNLDGYNIMLAWVRLVFIAHNRRQYSVLSKEFSFFENKLKNGKYYSRRILANFYSQYVLYFASLGDFKQASYYGYLSLREKNNDYLFYVNNLAAILLRNKSTTEAYQLLMDSSSYAKSTPNFHNKIGHTAYYIFTLLELGKTKQAENHAFVFLTAYKKQIFEYRWHVFFTAYFKSLLYNKKYALLKKVHDQYKMSDRDLSYSNSANYTPVIPWMYQLALYKLADISLQNLKLVIEQYSKAMKNINNLTILEELKEINKQVLTKEDFQI